MSDPWRALKDDFRAAGALVRRRIAAQLLDPQWSPEIPAPYRRHVLNVIDEIELERAGAQHWVQSLRDAQALIRRARAGLGP